MLKFLCTRHKTELYNAAEFFGPSASSPRMDIIPKQFTQVSSTAAFLKSYPCVKLFFYNIISGNNSRCER